MKLTMTAIGKFEYKGTGSDIRWDDQTTGLGVRIYPSGKNSFVLSYRFHSRKELMVQGRVGGLTLAESRLVARKHLGQVANGENPARERKTERTAGTMRTLCEKYMEHSREHKPKSCHKCRRSHDWSHRGTAS